MSDTPTTQGRNVKWRTQGDSACFLVSFEFNCPNCGNFHTHQVGGVIRPTSSFSFRCCYCQFREIIVKCDGVENEGATTTDSGTD